MGVVILPIHDQNGLWVHAPHASFAIPYTVEVMVRPGAVHPVVGGAVRPDTFVPMRKIRTIRIQIAGNTRLGKLVKVGVTRAIAATVTAPAPPLGLQFRPGGASGEVLHSELELVTAGAVVGICQATGRAALHNERIHLSGFSRMPPLELAEVGEERPLPGGVGWHRRGPMGETRGSRSRCVSGACPLLPV